MLTGDVYRYSEARTKRDIATDRAAGVDSCTPGGGLPDGPTEVGQEERLNARLGGTVVSQVFVEENVNEGGGDELDDEQEAAGCSSISVLRCWRCGGSPWRASRVFWLPCDRHVARRAAGPAMQQRPGTLIAALTRRAPCAPDSLFYLSLPLLLWFSPLAVAQRLWTLFSYGLAAPPAAPPSPPPGMPRIRAASSPLHVSRITGSSRPPPALG